MCSLFWVESCCSDQSSSSSSEDMPYPSPPVSRRPRRLAPMRGPPRGHKPFADYRIVVPEIEVSEDSYRVPPISDGADRWEEFSEVGQVVTRYSQLHRF